MAAGRDRLSVAATARPARAPTLGDVARLAGVSHQTVSRVVNDLPGVRPATRGRVLDAVRRLGYRPNAMARGLAGRRPPIIGVVGLGTVDHGPAATLRGIQRAAREAGYGVRIVTVDLDGEGLGPDALAAARGALATQSVAGTVVLPHLPAAAVDQAAGARLAVRHLLALGHRRVWHLSGPGDRAAARDRVAGWRAALDDAGVAAPPVLAGDWSARSGHEAGAYLAELAAREGRDAVTAVFAGNDRMALGLMRACYERGVRVPDDVSVVGFDDVPDAEFMWPPLTTVRQDFEEVGRRCVAALLRRAGPAGGPGGPVEPVEPVQPDDRVVPSLVVRRSTAPPGTGQTGAGG